MKDLYITLKIRWNVHIYQIQVLSADFQKPARKLSVTDLQQWILSNFHRLKRLWCVLLSSTSSTVVRYLWNKFVMYSVFVGGNCRYVGLLMYDNVRLIDGYKGFGRNGGLHFWVEGRGKPTNQISKQSTNQPTNQISKQSNKQPEDQPTADTCV